MLSDTFIYLCLSFLALAITLNLWLTLKLFRLAHSVFQEEHNALPLPVGSIIPSFTGSHMSREQSFEFDTSPQIFSVLVFMSASCDKCKEKINELESLYSISNQVGLSLWVFFNNKPRHIRYFLNKSKLLSVAIRINTETSLQLNPERLSPFYIFIDPERVIQATGLVGDQNWIELRKQISDQ